jgi:hypothetical protein
MEILRKKNRLRFYSPTCERTNKVAWRKELKDGTNLLHETEYTACACCDRDFAAHIKESFFHLKQ